MSSLLDQKALLANQPDMGYVAFHKSEIEQSLAARFEDQVRKYPSHIAIKDSSKSFTYQALNIWANQIARVIQSTYSSPQQPIALLFENNASFISAILSVLKTGNIYVPLDPAYPIQRMQTIVEEGKISLILTDSRNINMADYLENNGERVIVNIDNVSHIDSHDDLCLELSSNSLCNIFYTSGSTGRPKGVTQTHRNILFDIRRQINDLKIGPEDRFPLLFSPGFGATTSPIFCALLSGACVLPFDLKTMELAQLSKWLDEERITICDIGVHTFRHLIPYISEREAFPQLRILALVGEQVLKQDVELFQRHFSTSCLLHNALGTTETRTFSQYFASTSTPINESTMPVGYPIEGKTVLLLDDNSIPVSQGEVGEIAVKSAFLTPGYWKRPDLTERAFLPDPTGSVERTYLTGDLGRINPDGYLIHLGRKDFQVKIHGYRIELSEVEGALLQLGYLKEVAVSTIETNPGDLRLIAYIVPMEKDQVNLSQVRKELSSCLPHYMIPAKFVVLDALPLTLTGKVDRKALSTLPANESENPTPYTGPRTSVEEWLMNEWGELLCVAAIGAQDNFFGFGGHSLLVTRLLIKAREKFQCNLPLQLFFDHPTLEEQAAAIEEYRVQAFKESSEDEDSALTQIHSLNRDADRNTYPLASAQERWWFLSQWDPASPTFHVHTTYRLRGLLNREAFAASVQDIVMRHACLRTTFPTIDRDPVQVISSVLVVPVPIVDLSELKQSEQSHTLTRLIQEHADIPFDLTTGPLLRIQLIQFAIDDYVLLLTVHHIITDHLSKEIFWTDFHACYSARIRGQNPVLPPISITYADYALWQQSEGQTHEADLAYWRKQLAGAPPNLALPTDFPRPLRLTHQGAVCRLVLSRATTEHLTQLGQQEGVTVFMTLLAAFALVLARHTGQNDFVIGTPMDGRPHSKLNKVMGCFLNTLALRFHLSGHPTGRAWLRQVRDVCMKAYTHQDVSFERILAEIHPDRNSSRTPLFQILVNMLPNIASPTLPGLIITDIEREHPSSFFDLTLYIREMGDELHLQCVFQTALFESSTIARLLMHIQILLDDLLLHPDQPVSSYKLFPTLGQNEVRFPHERPLLSTPTPDFPGSSLEQSIPTRFEAQVQRHPTNLAVKTTTQAWTYEELNQRANQLAHTLVQRWGTKPGQIGIVCAQDAPLLTAILGVLKAGKTYVPLDPHIPLGRLETIRHDAQLEGLVCDHAHVELARSLHPGSGTVIDCEGLMSTESTENLWHPMSPETLAYLIYTSGSTSQPKGVMQNHRNVLHHCRTYTHSLHLCPTDRLTLFSSYAFDAAVMDIFGALLNGAGLMLWDLRKEPMVLNVVAQLATEGVTIYHSTPTVFRYLFSEGIGEANLSALRAVVLGGEETQPYDIQLFSRYIPPPALFVNGLGPTESTMALQYLCTHETLPQSPLVPIGYPVNNTEVVLLNTDGKPGEIYGEIGIESPYVAVGYWRQPELTQTVFRPGLTNLKARLYRTGDLGRLRSDGSLEFAGRKDGQIKQRGYRVELGEIETTIHEHPMVQQAVVLFRDDLPREKLLVAYIVPTIGHAPDAVLLRTHLRQLLPDYMIPSQFVILETMPLTLNGKIDKQALPIPQKNTSSSETSHIGPRTELEKLLVEIWQEVLQIERISIHDNFFELGGHSLLATRLVARLRHVLELNIPLRTIFKHPTIEQFSREIDAQLTDTYPDYPADESQPPTSIHS